MGMVLGIDEVLEALWTACQCAFPKPFGTRRKQVTFRLPGARSRDAETPMDPDEVPVRRMCGMDEGGTLLVCTVEGEIENGTESS